VTAGRQQAQRLPLLAALEPLLLSPLFRPGLVSPNLVADVAAFLTSLASARSLQPELEDFKVCMQATPRDLALVLNRLDHARKVICKSRSWVSRWRALPYFSLVEGQVGGLSHTS
jgi:hypothetical protein